MLYRKLCSPNTRLGKCCAECCNGKEQHKSPKPRLQSLSNNPISNAIFAFKNDGNLLIKK